MKTDVQLKNDVTEELRWDPTVTSTDINVVAKDGIVMLSGTVPHYAEKWAAERATQRVAGVKAITEAFPMAKANDAVAKVKKNQVRYRAVLAN